MSLVLTNLIEQPSNFGSYLSFSNDYNKLLK